MAFLGEWVYLRMSLRDRCAVSQRPALCSERGRRSVATQDLSVPVSVDFEVEQRYSQSKWGALLRRSAAVHGVLLSCACDEQQRKGGEAGRVGGYTVQ